MNEKPKIDYYSAVDKFIQEFRIKNIIFSREQINALQTFVVWLYAQEEQ